MTISGRDLVAAALAAVLASSCSTSPPGAGLTNGENAPISEEKPAVRDDLQMPNAPDSGDAKYAGSAATSPAGNGNDAGTGGRNAGQAGNPPAPSEEKAKEKEKGTASSSESPAGPPATPPKIESSGEAGAQGGTKPPGNINVGTPRSPQ